MDRRSPPTPPSRSPSPAAGPAPPLAVAVIAAIASMASMAPVVASAARAAVAADAGSPGSPRLARHGASWQVEDGGRSTPLDLAPGGRAEAVVRRGDGWLAVGTRPMGESGREIWLVESAVDGSARSDGSDGSDGSDRTDPTDRSDHSHGSDGSDRSRGPRGSSASSRSWRELVAPQGQEGRVRERPVAVVAGGAFVGLAWLEGDERRAYTVRWAGWRDGGFSEPVIVSPRGPGSQLALDATRLDDGRTVLVWSGYDGTDDEIWSSVERPGGGWTAPARVGADDGVPDVTPTLVAVPGGALLAWSRFDAESREYRLALARWSGEGFDGSRPLGTPGALAPRFERGGESPWLSWRDARADRWSLGQIGSDGALLLRSTAAGATAERPEVVWSDAAPPDGRFAAGEPTATGPAPSTPTN